MIVQKTWKEMALQINKQNKELKAKLEIAASALEFYGDISRWCGTRIIGDHYSDFENGNASIYIGGEVARKALEEIK